MAQLNINQNFFVGGVPEFSEISRKAAITDGLTGAVRKVSIKLASGGGGGGRWWGVGVRGLVGLADGCRVYKEYVGRISHAVIAL